MMTIFMSKRGELLKLAFTIKNKSNQNNRASSLAELSPFERLSYADRSLQPFQMMQQYAENMLSLTIWSKIFVVTKQIMRETPSERWTLALIFFFVLFSSNTVLSLTCNTTVQSFKSAARLDASQMVLMPCLVRDDGCWLDACTICPSRFVSW